MNGVSSLQFPLHASKGSPFLGAAIFDASSNRLPAVADLYESTEFADSLARMCWTPNRKFKDCAQDLAAKWIQTRNNRPIIGNQSKYLGYVRQLPARNWILVVVSPDWNALNQLELHTDLQVLEQLATWFLYHPERRLLPGKCDAIRRFLECTQDYAARDKTVTNSEAQGVLAALQRHRDTLAVATPTSAKSRSVYSYPSNRSLSPHSDDDKMSDASFGSLAPLPENKVLAVALYRPTRVEVKWGMCIFQSSHVQRRLVDAGFNRWFDAARDAVGNLHTVTQRLKMQGLHLFNRPLFGGWNCLLLLSDERIWRTLVQISAFDVVRHVVEEMVRPLDQSKKTQLTELREGLQTVEVYCSQKSAYQAMALDHLKCLVSLKKGEKVYPPHFTKDAPEVRLMPRGAKLEVEFIDHGVFKMNGRVYFQTLTADQAIKTLQDVSSKN